MVFYMVIFMGGILLGVFIIGWVGSVLGLCWIIFVGGFVVFVIGMVVVVYVLYCDELCFSYCWS